MLALYLAAGAALTAVLLLLILRVQLEFKIIIKNGRNFSFIIIRVLRGLLKLRFNISIKPDDKRFLSLKLRKTDSSLETDTSVEYAVKIVKRIFKGLSLYKRHLKYLLKRISFSNFSVRTRVGIGDASGTALVIGGFFAVFAFVTQYLVHHYRLEKHKLVVLPCFEGAVFDMDLDCIIDLKIGHIIIAGFKMALQKIKGGENGGTSNREHNENHHGESKGND